MIIEPQSPLAETSFVVIDVETTGLNAKVHRITDIALVHIQRNRILRRFETLIDPEQYIPPFIAEHTGITNAMVFGKPKFRQALAEILAFFESAGNFVLCGHNVQFDLGFYSASLLRSIPQSGIAAGPSITNDYFTTLCTLRLAQRLLPDLKRRSLGHVAAYLGIPIRNRHRAMGDAEATAQVMMRFLEMARDEHELSTLGDLLNFERKPIARIPIKRTKTQHSLLEHVRSFPERPGVYTMRDSRNTVVYVGKAKSLRDRVGSYFSPSHVAGTKHNRMMKLVRTITYEETGTELSALLLESKRIKEFSPRFNSIERKYRSYNFIRLDLASDFPKLEAVRQVVKDGSEYYGPFKSRESVDAMIEVLNRHFLLRECGDEFHLDASQKPCFYYDIARCSAPCALLITKKNYGEEVERLRRFFADGEQGVLALVEQMMKDAAEKLDFEEAQYLKMRWLEIKKILGPGERKVSSLDRNDCVVLVRTPSNDPQLEVFFVRSGTLVKQTVLTLDSLSDVRQWFVKQWRLYYAVATATHSVVGKDDIDEIRILAQWRENARKFGSRVLAIEGDPENLGKEFERLATEMLGGIQGMVRTIAPLESPLGAHTNTSFILSPESLKTAKRLTLKPMLKRS